LSTIPLRSKLALPGDEARLCSFTERRPGESNDESSSQERGRKFVLSTAAGLVKEKDHTKFAQKLATGKLYFVFMLTVCPL